MSRASSSVLGRRAVPLVLLVLLVALLPAAAADAAPGARGYDRSCGASAQGYTPFADVWPGTHSQAVGCLAFLGVAEGRTSGDRRIYQPRRSVRRDQMATFIARMMVIVPDDVYRLPSASAGTAFPDVAGVHTNNVTRLRAAGVVEGRVDGTYGQGSGVTRGQMASFVARAVETIAQDELPRSEGAYGDVAGLVHRENIEKLTAIGVVQGVTAGSYRPRTHISRQEMATMLARALDYLAAQGLFDRRQVPAPPTNVRVGSFTTPLVPGQARNQNIHQAAAYLDGARVAPGQRLSLNQAIGPRTRARGFTTNGFISDGEVISVVGGGISQLATTFMNAAWYSGIRIVTHQPHSQYFERYPPGRESTISGSTIDVVIENDSPHGMRIATSYTDSSVTVHVLSRPWARVSDRLQAPAGVRTGDAFTASYSRTVTYPDGSTSTDSYRHTYVSP